MRIIVVKPELEYYIEYYYRCYELCDDCSLKFICHTNSWQDDLRFDYTDDLDLLIASSVDIGVIRDTAKCYVKWSHYDGEEIRI